MGYRIRKLDISTKKQGMDEFAIIGSTLPGQQIMVNKIFPLALKVKGLNPRGADILKQEMLSRMGDVVTSRDSLIQHDGLTDVIMLGTEKSMRSLADKVKIQPFGLKKLSAELEEYLDFLKEKIRDAFIKIGDKTFDIIKGGPLIMGILNITDDSFYDGGRYKDEPLMKQRARTIIEEGAHIIDIGGLSTRPGSKPVSAEEEIARVIPAIKYAKSIIKGKKRPKNNYSNNVVISCDTYRSEVANAAISQGVDIINDISGLTFDKNMAETVANAGANVIIMHIKGTPEDMQKNPSYADVVDEVYDFLYVQSQFAIGAGIKRDKIIIDPGIGFGKTLEHNLKLLERLSDFTNMGFPVLIGASRKSFIGNLLSQTGRPGEVLRPADERLEGSLAAAVYAYLNGASILRVHDVRQSADALKIASAIKNI